MNYAKLLFKQGFSFFRYKPVIFYFQHISRRADTANDQADNEQKNRHNAKKEIYEPGFSGRTRRAQHMDVQRN